MKRAAIAVVLLCSVLASAAETGISASEAKNHVGENATVCGAVASVHYAATSRGRPTFLNLDQAYPNQIFTVVIWGSDRRKFGDPEAQFNGRKICVTGQITLYRGVPETVAHDPSQIKGQ